MIDYLNTVEEKSIMTLRYNNQWRILNNSGNTVNYDTMKTVEHLNTWPMLNGTKCIVLF